MTTRIVTMDGACEISSLPGQPQVAICHSFFVDFAKRGNGAGKFLKETQHYALANLHYDYAICTVANCNQAQKTILIEAGWQRLDSFQNRRSSEITEIWGRQAANVTNQKEEK
jgi:hypothetical protein